VKDLSISMWLINIYIILVGIWVYNFLIDIKLSQILTLLKV